MVVRKLPPDLAENDSLAFRGKLFADDKAIIYDTMAGEPVKRRKKRKADGKAEESAEGAAEGAEDEKALRKSRILRKKRKSW